MRLPLGACVLTGGGLVAGALLAAPGAAMAAWPAESEGGSLAVHAGELPAGEAPSARPGATRSSVRVSWPDVGGVPVGAYRLARFDAVTGEPADLAGSCRGLITGTSCAEDVPDGRWTYRVRAVLGGWTGAWSPVAETIVVDTSPIRAAVTFPVNDGRYETASFDGCGFAGFCGTASPAGGAALRDVRISVKQGGRYWDPVAGAFSSRDELLFAVTHEQGKWRYGFPAGRFGNGGITLRVVVRDDAGGTAVDRVDFQVKETTKPVVVAPVKTEPAAPGNHAPASEEPATDKSEQPATDKREQPATDKSEEPAVNKPELPPVDKREEPPVDKPVDSGETHGNATPANGQPSEPDSSEIQD